MFQEETRYGTTPIREAFGSSKARVSCHFLHFDQTEDIWLKSALERRSGISLITACYIVVHD